MTRTFFIIRHGQTRFNAEQRLQGHCNSPLTEQGQQQASRAGTRLHPYLEGRNYHVFCSPLGRAVETARIVCNHIKYPETHLHQDERLKEFSLGEWEQRTIPGLMTEYPHLRTERDWYLQAPRSEPYEAVQQRLRHWLDDLPASGDILVVTHALTGVVLRSLLLNLNYADTWQQAIPQDAFFMVTDAQITRVDYSCPEETHTSAR